MVEHYPVLLLASSCIRIYYQYQHQSSSIIMYDIVLPFMNSFLYFNINLRFSESVFLFMSHWCLHPWESTRNGPGPSTTPSTGCRHRYAPGPSERRRSQPCAGGHGSADSGEHELRRQLDGVE